jgi:rhodanese-related sulfurtransferase
VAPHQEEPEDPAASLANLECGVQEVRERLGAGEPVLLLDVREPYETAGGIIPGAKVIPLGKLPGRWEELKEANEVVCYCAAGMRSLQAAAFLRERGILNATSMEGGISAWMESGGEIKQP